MIDELDDKTVETGDEALLKEIRDRYSYYVDMWKEVQDEARIDMRYVCGDPWEEEDRRARKDAGRPCINHDLLNQYINQAANGQRQNPPGIKIEPAADGADEKKAQSRQNLIRGIEYRSKAQRLAYIPAFVSALERSYGFFRVSRKYVDDDSDDQEIWIKGIANPDSVLYDPDFKELDGSDAMGCFVLDPISRDEFTRRYPNAKKQSFSAEDARVAPQWIQDKIILVAEYWKIVVTQTKRGKRMVEKRTVKQYITNGVEILEQSGQPGKHIPIIPVWGKQRWITEGGVSKRKIESLVRLARDAQMSHAYLVSQEMEEAGLTPKVPYEGYAGQFETDKETWDEITKVPHAYVQANKPDWWNDQWGPPPLPQKTQFTPNFQEFEVAKDGASRAVQSAMGISPLPTAAQRQNEKSGVALTKIQSQEQVGSFHFVDSFYASLEFAARVIESYIPVVYDTERTVPMHKPDDTREMVKISPDAPTLGMDGKPSHVQIGDESYDCTISTGPSYQSQIEAAEDFLQTLITEMAALPLSPQQKQKLLGLAVQMKQLGPKGDQMAEIISPPNNGQQMPPQAQAAISQLQGQNQQLQQQLAAMIQEKQAKLVEWQYKLQETRESNASQERQQNAKLENALAIAEIETKAQSLSERMSAVEDMMKQFHSQAHDVAIQAQQQGHEQQMAQQQQAAQQQMQAQQAAQAQQNQTVQPDQQAQGASGGA